MARASYRLSGRGLRAEIERRRQARILRFALQPRAEPEIAAQTFQYVLPGTHSPGIANQHRFLASQRADAIRDELKTKGWIIEDTSRGPRLKKL